MARTVLNVQEISRAGLDPVLSAANVDGQSFANNGKTYLEVANGSGSGVTVTFLIPATVDGIAVANGGRQVLVPAGESRKIGPFPAEDYNQSDGAVSVDFSAVTTLTVGAFRLA